MPSRPDWLLLFIGADGDKHPLDQLRVMKGLFLLSLSLEPLSGHYSFTPYDFGPFDSKVYRDLDELQARGFIDSTNVGIGRRRDFWLTELGRRRYIELQASVSGDNFDEIQAAKTYVTSLDADALLSDVYERFPEFRSRSIARVARQNSAA
ncbi:MAG: hypothetical protein QM692_22350 [Thermomicrobiales bacterium]